MATPKLILLLNLLILIVGVGAAIAEPTEKSEIDTASFVRMSNITDCDKVLASLKGTSTELQQISCTKPATASAPSNKTGDQISSRNMSGPHCRTTKATLRYNDATALCNGIPNTYSLPPSYRQYCNCEIWSVGTAAWVVCNCDYCSSVEFYSLQGYCRSVTNNCLYNKRNRGGYYTNYNPTVFVSLYGKGGSDASPVSTQCG